MPTWWSDRYILSTVNAGPELFVAQAPQLLAIGLNRSVVSDAFDDADRFDTLFDSCPRDQWGAAAQAAMPLNK